MGKGSQADWFAQLEEQAKTPEAQAKSAEIEKQLEALRVKEAEREAEREVESRASETKPTPKPPPAPTIATGAREVAQVTPAVSKRVGCAACVFQGKRSSGPLASWRAKCGKLGSPATCAW